jgi:hypothetical protein
MNVAQESEVEITLVNVVIQKVVPTGRSSNILEEDLDHLLNFR